MSLLILLLAVPLAIFAVIKVTENALRAERRFGEVRVRMHAPAVSPLLAVRADSMTIRSPRFSLKLIRPSARLIDWFSLRPTSSALYLRADSAALRLPESRDSSARPVRFPDGLRFPVSATVEWRVLTVEMPGRGRMEVGAAQWRSRGRQALSGEFLWSPFPAGDARAEMRARVTVRADWRGPVLRFDAEARRGKEDRLRVRGAHEKRDLRLGTDSVEAYAARPADWLPPDEARRLGGITGLSARGGVNWSTRNMQVTLGARTASRPPLTAAAWTLDASAHARGGSFSLGARGEGQSLRARGQWSHPDAWPRLAPWRRWRADFSAEVRGGDWAIARWKLPMDFDVRSARLDTGLVASARLASLDGSELDARWRGSNPRRLEFSGPVSPSEPWAVAWTDSRVSYGEARVEGVWEKGRLTGVTRFREVRAYGAIADSVEAGHEVTSSAYTLQSARIHRDGEVFTGSGFVRWRAPSGVHAVSLRFEARHPDHGLAVFEMPRRGLLVATADNLRVAEFPYEPLARFQAFNPWVNGGFRWDYLTGDGEIEVDASYASGGNVLRASLQADWDKDSLRAHSADMTTGPSRVDASGVLPLGGRSLRGLGGGLQTLMGGTWRVGADSLRLADVFTLAGRTGRPLDGHVGGALEYSPSAGLSGEMKTGPLRIPALREWAEVDGISLQGLGDSVRVTAITSSKAYPVLNDTVRAIFSDLVGSEPRFHVRALSHSGFRMGAQGRLPEWKRLEGTLMADGSIPLGNPATPRDEVETLDSIRLDGDFSAPLNRDFLGELRFDARRLQVRYSLAGETQTLSGTPAYADGTLIIPDLGVRDARGGGVNGGLAVTFAPLSARVNVSGSRLGLVLPQGHRFEALDVSARAEWSAGKDLEAFFTARSGSFAFPPTPYRVEGAYDALRVQVKLPPTGPSAPPAKLVARASVHDFLFQRKIRIGFKDVWSLFSSLGRPRAGSATGSSRRSRPWDLDVAVEAKGTRNRIDTDLLRMTFIGDMSLQGIPPYALVNGRLTGLQGEVGQAQQAYSVRELDVKWDNATLQDGVLLAEGEKRVRTDCRPDTRQTCMMYVKLEGRLEDVNFTYDTDCGQNTGEAMAPAVLIRSMTQGCYAAELQTGETGYGSAVGIMEPVLNAQLSRGVARRSGGFIKSTQVSGLGALMGSDSSGFEAVAVEVESREVYRTGFKARFGYHPETKQANPTEYRMAAEYRPPLERFVSDSTWRMRLRDRFTVEAAVETRPETRDLDEERAVRQRAGLRYRYRFWGLW